VAALNATQPRREAPIAFICELKKQVRIGLDLRGEGQSAISDGAGAAHTQIPTQQDEDSSTRKSFGSWPPAGVPCAVTDRPEPPSRLLASVASKLSCGDRGFGPALTPPIRVSSPPLQPGGFSFALVGPGDLLALPLRPLVSRCDRFRRQGKSSGPPPFAPSLNVQGDDTHNNSGFSVI
jgi:hypothetical protein